MGKLWGSTGTSRAASLACPDCRGKFAVQEGGGIGYAYDPVLELCVPKVSQVVGSVMGQTAQNASEIARES